MSDDSLQLRKAELEERFPVIKQTAPAFLTAMQVEKLYGLPSGLTFANSLTLTAAIPASGSSFLSFLSALIVSADPSLPNNNYVLLNSQFAPLSAPQACISFQPINKSGSHLVEFTISISNPSVQYAFTVTGPFGTSQQITINQSQIISTVVPPIAADIGNYTVTVIQTNSASQNSAWLFHSVKVTALSS